MEHIDPIVNEATCPPINPYTRHKKKNMMMMKERKEAG